MTDAAMASIGTGELPQWKCGEAGRPGVALSSS